MWHAVKTWQNLQNLDFSVKNQQNLGANSGKVDNWSIDEANMSSWSPANRFLMVFLPRSVWVIELLVFLLPTFKVHKLWEPQFDAYTSPSRSLENASSVQFRAAAAEFLSTPLLENIKLPINACKPRAICGWDIIKMTRCFSPLRRYVCARNFVDSNGKWNLTTGHFFGQW